MQLAEHFMFTCPLTAQGVSFTNMNKLTLGGRIKTYMEARHLWIPEDEETAKDLTSVQKNITPAGNTQLIAERSIGGHADRFWALALALEASATARSLELGMAL